MSKINRILDHSTNKLGNKSLSQKTYDQIANVIVQWVKEIQLENPSVKEELAFSFSSEDFRIAQQSEIDYLANQRIPVCQDFAFYQLNEINAFPFIFNSQNSNWPKAFVLDPINYLSQWDYELVTEPLSGDLVVYCSTLKGFLEAKHWGIWTKEQKVLSKMGQGEVLKHPINDVIIGYGNFVYFFHKKIKSPLLKNFLVEIEKASDSIPSFLHSATYSPLSTLGCTNQMIEIFKKMSINNVFKNNIFNHNYNLEIKHRLISNLYSYSNNLSLSMALLTN